ncbi:MAG: polysaccharide biosynthesis protein [Bacteroidetes bacterium]|nr:MAG: polysaccharide biosynthesis protein [Bacteroidota bacterium]TAG88385.1 MAG: polysaccharide biosynthesis protein [Bacteroidota bacterium]
MSIFKKLASETALYGLSSMIGRLLTYLLVPLHTHLIYGFRPSEFGILTILYAYTAFLNIIYTYGMETSFFRFANLDKQNQDKTYQKIQTQLLITTLFFTFIFLFSADFLNSYFKYGINGGLYIRFLAFILFFDTLVALPFAYLRLQNKAKRFAFVKLIGIFLSVFFNIFFLLICPILKKAGFDAIDIIYHPRFSIGYVFLANLIASFITTLFLLDILVKKYKFLWDWQTLRPILNYGYPLLFMGLAGTINSMLDKILLEKWLPENFYDNQTSLDAVGIYGAAIKMGVLMTLAVQAFKYAAEPFFFSQAKEKQAPELFAKVMLYFVIVCAIMWVGVCVNLPVITYFFLSNSKYHQALSLVPMMLLANLLLGIYFNLTIWFKLTNKTYFGTYIAFFGAICTLIGNLFFIPILGYWACVLTTFFTYLLMSIVCEYYGKKYFPVPYRWEKIILYLGIGGFLILFIQFFRFENIYFNFFFGNFVWGIYIFYLLINEKINIPFLSRTKV